MFINTELIMITAFCKPVSVREFHICTVRVIYILHDDRVDRNIVDD